MPSAFIPSGLDQNAERRSHEVTPAEYKTQSATQEVNSQGFRAGDERIELPPKVLETPIIPFDQSPIQLSLNSSDLLSIPYGVRNVKKKIKKISH